MDNKKSCNSNIQCTVNSCAYHNPQNYCSLSQIKVGCTDASPAIVGRPSVPPLS